MTLAQDEGGAISVVRAPSVASLPVTFGDLDRSNERHVNFVRSSWAKCAVTSRPSKVWCDKEGKPSRHEQVAEHSYFAALAAGPQGLINRILARCKVVIAVPNVTPNTIAGWIAHDATTLHYVYVVSNPFRRMGIGRALLARLPATVTAYSFWSPAFEKIAPAGMTWRPDVLWSVKGCE